MGRKQRLFPKVAVQSPAKDLHSKVQSSLPYSQHRILSSREEDSCSRGEQIPHFNQEKNKSLPLSDQRTTPVPSQCQKHKETTRQLPDSDNQKVPVLLPYLDKWKMTKPPTPHKHHYAATVLPSTYHEYKTKGIPMSLPSLGQCVTPLLRPDQKVQIRFHPDSWTENLLDSDQVPKFSHYPFNQYSTATPITNHWFEVPLCPSSQDRAMIEPLTCHSHQAQPLLSGKPWVRETPHLNHWHRAIVKSLPFLDHWYRATDFNPSHSHLYSRSRVAIPSLQANLYTKVTIPCSLCPYQWVKSTSTLSSQGKVMVMPSPAPQLQARTKPSPSLGPELSVKGTDYSPCPDYCGELASMPPPCHDNMTEVPQKPDNQSKDIFGSLPSPDPHDTHPPDTNHCDEPEVSLGLNHEITS
ncbi:uncharacterized protein LOC118836005 [Trichosurus vulpecula]|uniref:uncharacterized protein LOC118836005 n=1 Tax=Trichosurus vulpecula TaxID=9337 RepID=UPI00186B0D71|nr:uncharacterized protein LOC118836005 [Trichosurus vulpecula]XP_036599233.1 uncharacterized protein LOC118836005 [Trichosurus vulpecula]